MTDVCEHGNLARQCRICELEAEKKALASRLRSCEESLRSFDLRDESAYWSAYPACVVEGRGPPVEEFEAKCEAVADLYQGECIHTPGLDCFKDQCCQRLAHAVERQCSECGGSGWRWYGNNVKGRCQSCGIPQGG